MDSDHLVMVLGGFLVAIIGLVFFVRRRPRQPSPFYTHRITPPGR
jgi:LPXTG-motif cell wall-anchored protein